MQHFDPAYAKREAPIARDGALEESKRPGFSRCIAPLFG
jgi:hypothetical protein